MFSYIIAAALIVTAPVMAECNCSPEKIEALRAKLRAAGASEEKVKDVNCEDVCEAEKPLANSGEGTDAKESSSSEEAQIACETEESKSSTKEESVLAGCNCGGKKGQKGNVRA